MLKYLNEVPPSDDWFPYEYIDAEVNDKLYKTKGRLAGNEMEKDTKIGFRLGFNVIKGFATSPNLEKASK